MKSKAPLKILPDVPFDLYAVELERGFMNPGVVRL